MYLTICITVFVLVLICSFNICSKLIIDSAPTNSVEHIGSSWIKSPAFPSQFIDNQWLLRIYPINRMLRTPGQSTIYKMNAS